MLRALIDRGVVELQDPDSEEAGVPTPEPA